MHRRWALAFLVSTVYGAKAGTPTAAQWSSFNASLGGRLQVATPIARPCFSSAPGLSGSQNAAQCSTVQSHYVDHNFRASTFAGYMNTEWETCQATTAQCLLDENNPANPAAFTPPATCSQGSIPSYYVDITSVTDAQAVFAFAKVTGVSLAIKNSGHDYVGRSSGPGSLGVWTHNLQGVAYSGSFVGQGCAKTGTPAVTFGAGVTHQTLYTYADQNGITLPGGADGTVGAAGGYLQGGGHSILSNVVGLAVDRVLQFEVVTPNGQHLFANACQNTDLFFALRGGGGGTFGIVLAVTMKALPKMTIATAFVSYAPTDDNQRKFLQFFIANNLAYAKLGWGGYLSPRSGLVYTNPLINEAQATSGLATMQSFVSTLTNGTFLLVMEPSYLSLFNDFVVPAALPVGVPFAIASHLVSADNFATTAKQTALLNAIIPAVDSVPIPIIFANTPYYFKGDGQTSVQPGWRTSLWHVTISQVWNFDTTLAQRTALYQGLTTAMNPLRTLSPNTGAYQNEADVYEPNYSTSFWGSNYAKLQSIKTKYDPNHLLDCWHCVSWKGASDAKYKCYIPDPTDLRR